MVSLTNLIVICLFFSLATGGGENGLGLWAATTQQALLMMSPSGNTTAAPMKSELDVVLHAAMQTAHEDGDVVLRSRRMLLLSPDGKSVYALVERNVASPLSYGSVNEISVFSWRGEHKIGVVCDVDGRCDVTWHTLDAAPESGSSDSCLSAAAFRVASWNVGGGWASGEPWEKRIGAVNAVLKDLNADIIALQEVRAGDAEHRLSPLLASSDTHPFHVYAPAAVFLSASLGRRVEEGVALVSRWPILDYEVVSLASNASEDANGRVALVARVLVPSCCQAPGVPVSVVVTHMSFGEAGRMRQSAELNSMARSLAAHSGVIVAGDFNAEPTDPTMPILMQDTLSDMGKDSTFPACSPSKRIDYIVHGGGLRAAGGGVWDAIGPVERRVPPDPLAEGLCDGDAGVGWASDHLPVFCDFLRHRS